MSFVCAAMLLIAVQQPAPATSLSDVMRADRVRDDRYRLIMFRLADDTASGFALVERVIRRTSRDGVAALEVREENRASASRVTIELDAASLRPLTYEATFGDTLAVSAHMDGDSLRSTETRRGVVTNSTVPVGSRVYFSSSFSELIQANDFGRHPRISFSTLTPGAPANTFLVERVGRRAFGRGNDVFVLKFTRTDANGRISPVGYRYVDVRTGKVLFFATDLDSPTGFTYQALPLR